MTDLEKRARIDFLADRLNEASRAYYTDGIEIITKYEYDEMYDELLALEDETGYIRDDSPSINVGFETAAGLPKIVHEIRMLSLNKTKTVMNSEHGWEIRKDSSPGSLTA